MKAHYILSNAFLSTNQYYNILTVFRSITMLRRDAGRVAVISATP